MSSTGKLVCVSNRLPVSSVKEGQSLRFLPSSGGLVTAIAPILTACSGMWVGWPGAASGDETEVTEALRQLSLESKFDLAPVILDQAQIEKFYLGFSNQIIWPLFHDLQSRCNFDPEFWDNYRAVQEKFALQVAKQLGQRDLVWIHDYHLMGLGLELQKLGIKNNLCFFLHTPFPSPDIFLKLPWRQEVVESLLSYRLIGFQTKRDLNNFVACVDKLANVSLVVKGSLIEINISKRCCVAGHFPISIDFNEFDSLADSTETELSSNKIRSDMGTEILALAVDRLDYTKGIPYRIRAFKRLLEIAPELKRRIALLQVVVPSRVEIPEYQTLKQEIEQLVTQVNGQFGEPGWMPVHHLFRSLSREELIAMYRAASLALVTPLKDGMNLVAKEYCASQPENAGALILSEFAGSADELGSNCFVVNPYDIDGVARTLLKVLSTTQTERYEKMQALRASIKENDIYRWAQSFLYAVNSNDLDINLRKSVSATIWNRFWRMLSVLDI